MDSEGCVEGKSPRFAAGLHSEAVRVATLAGGLLRLSLVHKPGGLEIPSMISHSVVIQNEEISYPGDPEHSNLHGAAECVLPWVAHSHIARAFVVRLRYVDRAVASELDETAGKTAGEQSEIGEWSSVVFGHQIVSNTC